MFEHLLAIELSKKSKSLVGECYGRLTPLRPVEKRKNGHIVYVCQCKCGHQALVTSSNLKSGHTQSCGCVQRETVSAVNGRHRKSRTKIYRVWSQMMQRCSKVYAPNYRWYGGSGVTVDPRWHAFEAFYADMGEAPAGLTLERVDHKGPYSPENCIWASRKAQAQNTRRTRRVTYQGVTRCVTDWERQLGVRKDFLGKRLRRGLSVERAFEDQNKRNAK